MISSCPICGHQVLTAELERHANSHFEDDEVQRDMELAQLAMAAELSTSTVVDVHEHSKRPFPDDDYLSPGASSSIIRGPSSYGKLLDEQISCLVGAQVRSEIQRIEGGVMNLLRSCLESEGGSSTSIISGYVDHHQSLSSEDKGWGCGWRNIQMMSSHLLKQRAETREALFGGCGFVPDIPSLQRWLEIAWDKGFDTLGASHFDNKIYGVKKWIGTSECVTLLRSFGVRARIVDFDSTESSSLQGKSGKRVCGPMDKYLVKTNPPPRSSPCELSQEDAENMRGQQVLVDWVWNYFSSKRADMLHNSKNVIVSDKTPLYFQHQGHSRTIIGIQKQKGNRGSQDQYNLLVLDPGHRTADLETSLTTKKGWQRHLKRGVHTLRKPQYQLCYVEPGIASSEEIERLKTIDSILIRF
ncbi:zinc finger-containing ubiquitin peptidase 1 [Hordeum vulgare subsp. vulgare]|uniref:UFSP1/2/DUB catalytic domain-containing protein n=1 Tax=Hordeum vulgare subsp. vulgare TaxID=112509 RepID=M0ZBV3_HORVV|nr:zinc finger-containing ubiquitin peptidase 1 [Hordeum vulgare subsp. vulgare]XP_044951151.1 zinc finger-containing ubiquitin peptidase 1 [Hordeum vulgare subsp. vulgare]